MATNTIDPEEYIRENREEILTIIRNSDDVFTRACAWTLLDRYTPDMDAEKLQEELETVINRRDNT